MSCNGLNGKAMRKCMASIVEEPETDIVSLMALVIVVYVLLVVLQKWKQSPRAASLSRGETKELPFFQLGPLSASFNDLFRWPTVASTSTPDLPFLTFGPLSLSFKDVFHWPSDCTKGIPFLVLGPLSLSYEDIFNIN